MLKLIDDLDVFLNGNAEDDARKNILIASKRIVDKSMFSCANLSFDFIIFYKCHCKIIELKDGFMFDTKKVKGEKQNLEAFAAKFGSKIPFSTDYYICCFNEDSKEKIREGLKNEFKIEHIMTGVELCEILKISYEKIRRNRFLDSQSNLDYFVSELFKIDEVKNKILKCARQLFSEAGSDK